MQCLQPDTLSNECYTEDNLLSTPKWSNEVKDLAYTLDPECWVSYSGKPKQFKRAMERRRLASLYSADDTLNNPF